jgi:hypothetical protein
MILLSWLWGQSLFGCDLVEGPAGGSAGRGKPGGDCFPAGDFYPDKDAAGFGGRARCPVPAQEWYSVVADFDDLCLSVRCDVHDWFPSIGVSDDSSLGGSGFVVKLVYH